MKFTFACLFLMVSSFVGAETIYLSGNNADPGFLTLVVGGTTVEALDYTGNRYASQGQTWDANLYTFSNLQDAYYGPSDPDLVLSNYVATYEEDVFLFELLAASANPASPTAETCGIQNAIYYLSGAAGGSGDCGATITTNSYVTEAQTAIAAPGGVASLGNLSNFVFVDSPFTTSSLVQGFMFEEGCTTCGFPPTATPEPGSMLLLSSALIFLGLYGRKKITSQK